MSNRRNPPPGFPPVVPLRNLSPWDAPQTLLRDTGGPTRRDPVYATGGGMLAPGSLPSAGFAPESQWTAEAHRYASMIALRVSAELASARVLDAPTTYRNFLAFRNTNALAVLFIDFGRNADTNSVFRLAPNQVIAFDTVVPQDDVYVISDTAASFLSLVYSTVALPPNMAAGGV